MRRPFSLFLAMVLAGVASGPALRAQTNWTAASSGTAQTLWGVCYGGGRFVAVGEGGTILTSPDGSTWTTRTSGTNVWLTSVAYGFAHYIVVGDNGTVLSSQDGITWESANARTPSAPAIRLNVVRFDGAEFLAYGEHNYSTRVMLPLGLEPGQTFGSAGTWWRGFATGLGHNVLGGQPGLLVHDDNAPYLGPDSLVASAPIQSVTGVVVDHEAFVAVGGAGAIVTSTNGTSWTAQSSGTTANLQDLVAFNNTLIAVGEGGAILSLDGSGAWTQRSAPTTQMLLGVAGSDTTAVAVGFGGTILRSSAALQPPAIISAPAGLAETIGGAASFVVRASGSAPLSYQWFRNNTLLAGETRPALTRTPLTTSDAGSYTVTVINSAGAVTSSAATLALLPAPAPVVDLSFNADPFLDGSPTALLPLADGGVLVADGKKNQLVKLRTDGSLDSAWTISTFGPGTNAGAPSVRVLVAQPDGRILVGGFFLTLTGPPRANLVRLNADGTLDASFVPAAEATVTNQSVTAIALQADNKILIANNGLVPLRLLPDGRLDPAFAPQPLVPGLTRFGEARNWGISFVGPAAGGRVVAAANVDLRFTNGFPLRNLQVVRFLNDGAADPSFTPFAAAGTAGILRVLNDDGVLVLGSGAGPLGSIGDGFVTRLRSDGSAYPNYRQSALPDYPAAPYIYPDGSFIVSGVTQQSPIRYTPTGATDPSFTGGIGRPAATAVAASGQVYVAGAFDVYDGQARRLVARLNVVANGSVNAPRILSFAADKTTVAYGETVTLRAAITGSAALTYEWIGIPVSYANNSAVRTTSPVMTFAFSATGPNRRLQLIVRNPSGEAVSAPMVFTVLPDAPVITNQPTRVSAQSGRDLSLPVERNATAGNTLEYEWRRNGQILPQPAGGFLGPPLFMPKVTAADAGSYTLTMRNALGVAVTSAPIILTIDDSSRLANLSTRAFVGPGEQVLIAGFSISGAQTRKVLIRASGPGLAKFGVADTLAAPQIKLLEARTGLDYSLSFSKDGWDANSTDGNALLRGAFAQVGAFPLDPGSKDAAGVAQLPPGNYTVQIFDKSGQTGTALVEIYEFDNDAARMLNVSSRAMVTPASPAICGLSIQGPVAKRVLLRGVGPTLGGFGISGVLANPRLTLKDNNGNTVALNDDWDASPNTSDLRAAMPVVGAFALPAGSRDAALLVTLAPGNYTLIVEGTGGQSGVALVEAYEVP